MQLRPYQEKNRQEIYDTWNAGHRNVLSVMPTGAGKTVVFSEILREHKGASCAIAHRQELVVQMSLALARDGVMHRIVGPKKTVALAVNVHMSEVGRSFYDPTARCAAVGVNTLIRREEQLRDWLQSVTLWITDEAHHILTGNQWGRAVDMFPNAKGLGVTATPKRADGKGLGRHTDGVFDRIVEGPTMRELIHDGYLTDYRIFGPPNDIDLREVAISSTTGDYSKPQLTKAMRKSQIVGDVVDHYLKIANGKLGITFATDVQSATDISAKFNECGVPSAIVSAKTPDAERIATVKRFRNRELHQLVNVDLFGEGFDLPAIEVVSMARPTQSYGLYAQQFGRALRPMEGKEHAIIIDHVGNVMRHGLPDAQKYWTLDRRDSRRRSSDPDGIPVKVCTNCTAVYERIYRECPFCGHCEMPADRSGPDLVDGDLSELDPAMLARMRGDIERVDMDIKERHVELLSKRTPGKYISANLNRHTERQIAQKSLRSAIAYWAGIQRAKGRSDSESYRRFYFAFGVDVMTAQTYHPKKANELLQRLGESIKEEISY